MMQELMEMGSCCDFNPFPLMLRYSVSGWRFQTFFIFHNIWDNPLPIDELIFFKIVIKPPTRYKHPIETMV